MTPFQQQAATRAAKNESILREIRDLESGFEQLNRSLDVAADEGDQAQVERYMAQIEARKIMLASARRRLEANKVSMTEDAKVAAKKANIEAAQAIVASLNEDVTRVEEIKSTIDALVHQLSSIMSKAQPARAHAAQLTLQLPKRMQERYWSLIREVGNDSTMLGSLLEDALLRGGVFSKLARSDTAHLMRSGGLPPMVDAYRNRAEKLSSAAHSLANTVNDEIQ